MSSTKEDVGKLPKWAQDRIRTLEMRLEEARRRELAATSQTPTRITTRAPRDFTKRVFHAEEIYRFHVGTGADDWVEVQLERDRIKVSTGAADLALLPWSGNVVKILSSRH